MKKMLILLFLPLLLTAQTLPVQWEELVSGDWSAALEKSGKTCVLPLGIIEKHGPHGPLGTDLIAAHDWSVLAAKKEYAVVFPPFYFGQINEAKNQPGTIAYSADVVWSVLEATCDEIGRNGFGKILIVNGHGGNNSLVKYFIQTRLEKPRPYTLYLAEPPADPEFEKRIEPLRKAPFDSHAGETESSVIEYLRPGLVKPSYAARESGADQNRLDLPGLYTAVWWYARFPNQYAGDGSAVSAELGRVITEHEVNAIVTILRKVKADQKTREIEDEFFRSQNR
ncbi:MAG: creatininase family protein [bacterium]|nr:creatininase family protein [bacterium]